MGNEGLAFQEAIEFLRGKVNIPTERWNELWQGMHARGFMVAGANRDAILVDFRRAVDKAIAEGTTLEEFRKDFDAIVVRHGWSHKGSRNWRSEVIYTTNVRQAYNAGRWAQLTDPDLLSVNPYLEYRHGDSKVPRPLHLSWNGLVLPADDPWWRTHYPQNGWGCKCKVLSAGPRDLAKMGKSGPDKAPDDGTYTWVDKKTGEEHTIPNGIDPGFDYNVGIASTGRRLQEAEMAAWRKEGGKAWQPLTPGTFESYDRPAKIPLDPPSAKPGPRVSTPAEMAAELKKVLGGEEKSFVFRDGEFGYATFVNAEALAAHVDPARSPWLPFITEMLEDPYEVWLAFEQHKGTGQVVLRQRVVKAVAVDGKEGLLLVANTVNGRLEGWTFVPTGDMKYLNRQRYGKLIWKR